MSKILITGATGFIVIMPLLSYASWHGYIAILVFIFVLTVALVYEWRSGALEWGVDV